MLTRSCELVGFPVMKKDDVVTWLVLVGFACLCLNWLMPRFGQRVEEHQSGKVFPRVSPTSDL